MIESDIGKVDRALHAVLKKLGDTYRFIKHLGGGEYSNVYLVMHIPSEKELALKILDYLYLLQRLKKEGSNNIDLRFNEIKRRFLTEARLYKKMDHPNIVNIHDAGVACDENEEIEIPYFIMDYVKGNSLETVIKESGPMQISRVFQIAQNILGALDVIHQNNIIHRDMKPANIMIDESSGQAILIDFGIAKDILSSTKLTSSGALLGSPLYMAPEQFIDSSKVSPMIDIYSFGAVLYEMLAGEPPFKGSNYLEIMNAHSRKNLPSVLSKSPALPPAIDYVLAKSMAKEPNNRYKSGKEMWHALKYAERKKFSRKWLKYILYFAILQFSIIAVSAFFMLDPLRLFVPKNPYPPGPKVPEPQIITDYNVLLDNLLDISGRSVKIKKCDGFLRNYAPDKQGERYVYMINHIREKKKFLEVKKNRTKEYYALTRSLEQHIDSFLFDKAKELAEKSGPVLGDEKSVWLKTIEDKKNQYENIDGGKEYEALKNKIALNQFLAFRAKYPASVFLAELKATLLSQNPTLPPEKYWTQSVKKNRKGYFEMTFGEEFNNHTMIYIPEKKIWIDKYEVSNAQYRRYLVLLKKNLPKPLNNKYIGQGDDYPAVVSYNEAENYCKKFGLRLPELDEWEITAGKGVKYEYPWGNESPGAGGVYQANFDSLDDTGEKDGFEGTAPVKVFERFSSHFDAFNMAGNVWEWIRGRILKGGGIFSKPDDLRISESRGGRENDSEGFRCVKDEGT